MTRRSLQGVGSFKLDLWNQDHALDGVFAVDAAVYINLAAVLGGNQSSFFGGYVDISDLINTQDKKTKMVCQLAGEWS